MILEKISNGTIFSKVNGLYKDKNYMNKMKWLFFVVCFVCTTRVCVEQQLEAEFVPFQFDLVSPSFVQSENVVSTRFDFDYDWIRANDSIMLTKENTTFVNLMFKPFQSMGMDDFVSIVWKNVSSLPFNVYFQCMIKKGICLFIRFGIERKR